MDKDLLIETHNISKSFPGVYALKNMDFSLEKGEIHALLGENGAGKSTFIKILAGMYQPDCGNIEVEGMDTTFKNPSESINKGISVIHQELNLASNISVAENIFLGRFPQLLFGVVKRKSMFHQSKIILEKVGLNVSPNTRVVGLSIAQQQLLEIAKALSLDAKVLIMDEPTSSLSPNEIKKLFSIMRELKSQGIGIIYVSHKLDELFEVCDSVTVLRDGEKVKTLKISETNHDELISLMVGRKVDNSYTRVSGAGNEIILQVDNISNDKLDNISFQLKKGEILGFSGLMGAGKTEIARAVFGIDQVTSGEVYIDGKKLPPRSPSKSKEFGIGFLPEDRKRDGLFLSLSVKMNMTISILNQITKSGVISKSKEIKCADEQVDALKIKTPSLVQKINNLSGGNQQKVILARWLLSNKLKVLIIDEPTRGIDVGAKFEIYHILNELAKQGVSIIAMSSEMQELFNICDRIIVLREGKITAELSKDEANQENIMKNSIY